MFTKTHGGVSDRMLEGDRSKFADAYGLLVLLAIVVGCGAVIWSISADYARHSAYAAQDARQERVSGTSNVARVCAGQQGSLLIDCVTEQVKSSRDQERSAHNLQAQQDMADWTFWIMLLSVGSLVLAGGGLWFIRETLNANTAMVRAAYGSERPFGFFYRTIKSKDEKGEILETLGVNFWNFGKSPAFIVRFTLQVGFFERAPNPETATEDYIMPQPSVIPVHDGWPLNGSVAPKNFKECIEEYKRGRRDLYMYGILWYRDTYGGTHKTWFSRIFDGRNFVFGKDPHHEDLLKAELNGYT